MKLMKTTTKSFLLLLFLLQVIVSLPLSGASLVDPSTLKKKTPGKVLRLFNYLKNWEEADEDEGILEAIRKLNDQPEAFTAPIYETAARLSTATILHQAAACRSDRSAEFLHAIFETPSVDLNIRDDGGYTPLHRAAIRGSLPCAEVLINNKADKTIHDFTRFQIPLYYAKDFEGKLARGETHKKYQAYHDKLVELLTLTLEEQTSLPQKEKEARELLKKLEAEEQAKRIAAREERDKEIAAQNARNEAYDAEIRQNKIAQQETDKRLIEQFKKQEEIQEKEKAQAERDRRAQQQVEALYKAFIVFEEEQEKQGSKELPSSALSSPPSLIIPNPELLPPTSKPTTKVTTATSPKEPAKKKLPLSGSALITPDLSTYKKQLVNAKGITDKEAYMLVILKNSLEAGKGQKEDKTRKIKTKIPELIEKLTKDKDLHQKKQLLETGIYPPNYRGHWTTVLHEAAGSLLEESASLLLEAGMDPNIKDSLEITPLHEAAYYGSLPCVELLLGKGANKNAITKDTYAPRTPYDEALSIEGRLLDNGTFENAPRIRELLKPSKEEEALIIESKAKIKQEASKEQEKQHPPYIPKNPDQQTDSKGINKGIAIPAIVIGTTLVGFAARYFHKKKRLASIKANILALEEKVWTNEITEEEYKQQCNQLMEGLSPQEIAAVGSHAKPS